MVARPLILLLLGILTITACQPAAPATPQIDTAGTETQAAAALQAAQTSTAAAERSAAETLTAVPTQTSTPLPAPTARRVHLDVQAKACWVNTGVKLGFGETVEIVAAGEASTWEGHAGSSSGPDGQKGICGDVQCPMMGAKYGALIGRIGEEGSFLVGSRLKLTVAHEGDLFLTVNDWQCKDNSGAFPVRITWE